MAVLAYSLKDKKNTSVKSNLKLTKYKLPNGNTISIICGKNKTMDVVCTIVSNERTKQGAKKVKSKK